MTKKDKQEMLNYITERLDKIAEDNKKQIKEELNKYWRAFEGMVHFEIEQKIEGAMESETKLRIIKRIMGELG